MLHACTVYTSKRDGGAGGGGIKGGFMGSIIMNISIFVEQAHLIYVHVKYKNINGWCKIWTCRKSVG